MVGQRIRTSHPGARLLQTLTFVFMPHPLNLTAFQKLEAVSLKLQALSFSANQEKGSEIKPRASFL